MTHQLEFEKEAVQAGLDYKSLVQSAPSPEALSHITEALHPNTEAPNPNTTSS